ncbi:uncharacterized protein LOC111354371 [Spodoptera litura]|nr:uncharacterized protein LOC111354371 [Spodoptera litura]
MKIPVAELKKKRDSLMATYRSHKRRVIASIQSGAAAESVYKPIWFAYEFMDSFLNNIVQCRNTLNTDTQNTTTTTESEKLDGEEEVVGAGSAPTTSSLETVPRRRKNPMELQEAGKTMKEAMSSLNKVLNKPVVPEDDFDRYGKILANKLRKLSETDSLKMMYEIDGLFIKRINAIPSYFTQPSPTYTMHSEPTSRLVLHSTTSPTYYVRPESACTTYSDPGVQRSHSDNVIQILSDEIVSPPTDSAHNTDIVNQAFYEA